MSESGFQSLVVDDEEWIRQGLVSKLSRSGLPFGSILEASDSESALKLLAEGARPDIILCDIRMPGLDGLDLSAEFRRRLPEAGIIIISGYNEFEYARKALKAGVDDYLLKPIDAYELYTTVKKCLDSLSSSRLNASRLESAKSAGGSGGSLPELSGTELRNLACAYLYAVCSDKVVPQEAVSAAAGENSGLVGFYENKSHEYVLLFRSRAEAFPVCLAAIEELKRRGAKEPAIGLSAARERVEDAVNEAAGIMKHRILMEDAGVIAAADIGIFSGRYAIPAHCLTSLRRGLEGGSVKTVLATLQDIGDELATVRPSYQCVENVYMQLLMLAGEAHSLDIEAKMACFPREAYVFSSVRTMIAFLKDVFTSLINVSSPQKKHTRDETVHEIAAFIDQNYGDYICLDRLAADRSINPCYLSLLFKEVMGLNFQDYLMRVRIQNAKTLLAGGGLKISEVAERTGFTNRFYFSRAFKKIVGSTPSDFGV